MHVIPVVIDVIYSYEMVHCFNQISGNVTSVKVYDNIHFNTCNKYIQGNELIIIY